MKRKQMMPQIQKKLPPMLFRPMGVTMTTTNCV